MVELYPLYDSNKTGWYVIDYYYFDWNVKINLFIQIMIQSEVSYDIIF